MAAGWPKTVRAGQAQMQMFRVLPAETMQYPLFAMLAAENRSTPSAATPKTHPHHGGAVVKCLIMLFMITYQRNRKLVAVPK